MKLKTPSGLKIYFSEVFPHPAISAAITDFLADKVMETPDERLAQISNYEPVVCNGKCSYYMAYQIELANKIAN